MTTEIVTTGPAPEGSELERAALALFHDVTAAAWKARDAGGPGGFERAYYVGLLDAFDVLAHDVGDVDDARAAFGWALDRTGEIVAEVKAARRAE